MLSTEVWVRQLTQQHSVSQTLMSVSDWTSMAQCSTAWQLASEKQTLISIKHQRETCQRQTFHIRTNMLCHVMAGWGGAAFRASIKQCKPCVTAATQPCKPRLSHLLLAHSRAEIPEPTCSHTPQQGVRGNRIHINHWSFTITTAPTWLVQIRILYLYIFLIPFLYFRCVYCQCYPINK
jgi:hypothetical protein